MPRYTITSPQGQSVTVEGSHVPNDAEIQEIFASIPSAGWQPASDIQQSAGAVITPQTQNNAPKAPVRKLSTGETVERMLDQTARSMPLVGAIYDPSMAGMDAFWDSIFGDKSFNELYKENMAKRKANAEAFAKEQNIKFEEI